MHLEHNLGGFKSEMQLPTWIATSMDCGMSLLRVGFGQLAEGLNGAAPVERLARPVVEQIGNGMARLLIVYRQVRVLGLSASIQY